MRVAAIAAGWTDVWCGDSGGQAQFSYLEHPDSPVTIVELMELNDLTRSLNESILAAAQAWEPGQPVQQPITVP